MARKVKASFRAARKIGTPNYGSMECSASLEAEIDFETKDEFDRKFGALRDDVFRKLADALEEWDEDRLLNEAKARKSKAGTPATS